MKTVLIRRFAVVLAAFAVLSLLPVNAASAAQILSFKAQHSSLCLDVNGGSSANGAKVQQWTCNGSNAQRWELVYAGSGPSVNGQAGNYYKIVNQASGKCLEVEGWATHDGAKITQWDCHGGANQQWLLYNYWAFGNKSSLVNRHSQKCVDVFSASQAVGATVGQWRCALSTSAGNQNFWW